jgi:fluoroacetyl-CoA thioesterase
MAGQRPWRDAQVLAGDVKVNVSGTSAVARAAIGDCQAQENMNPISKIALGMTAEKTVTVTPEMTVGHFVVNMPRVYATAMMILHMEMAAGASIASYLPEGFVSVGMDVKVRHVAATPIGRTVRAISRVIQIEAKSVVFEVEAWDGHRKIGDGTHRRGIVNLVEFEERYGVRQFA